MHKTILALFFTIIVITFSCFNRPVSDNKTRIINISEGWAGNSINAVIFRQNSVVSFNEYQYVAFYDNEGNVILAKRNLDSIDWQIKNTQYQGNIKDAHNSISIMIDGNGYLHISWNQHGSPLHYCKSKYPLSLELTDEIQMTGYMEQSVTYPEFYKLPGGNLIFLYRNGESGDGNLVLNYYETKTKTWSNVHKSLIDGEGERNAYWQAAVDLKGTIHISWVWRESWDVATNHDLCYAKSIDSGKTWLKSDGEKYQLPITIESAECIAKIPQGRELINQTSMYVNNGYPFIASYWTPDENKVPQYHIVYFDGNKWQVKRVSKRSTAFNLSGGGTKSIPISRPQILVHEKNNIYLIFRDIERDNRVTIASCNNIEKNIWSLKDLTSFSVGKWEPTYDTELWKTSGKLHIFIQNVVQRDAEATENVLPEMISILEWEPE